MRTTRHLDASDPEQVREAARLLRDGALVAFATETVYGLGANALSAEAVAGIFRAKEGPAWDPLIVHLASVEAVAQVARVPAESEQRVRRLMGAFWPGPLTLLLPRTPAVPDAVTAGRELVGVRVPRHPVALALLGAAGVPVAAPSANRFGHVSPTTAEHVLADLNGRIDAVLDAGPCSVGVESTVLDPLRTPVVIYRQGAVTAAMLLEATGVAAEMYHAFETEGMSSTEPQSLPSPGVGLRHYAPCARLLLVEGGDREVVWARALAESQTRKTGLLWPEDWAIPEANAVREGTLLVQPWGHWVSAETRAAALFSGLRALDAGGVQAIVCPLPEPGGLDDALRERLEKAARTA